jgi:hypothetical protein
LNREAILATVRAALDPKGEAYVKAQAKWRHLPPDAAERSRVHDLAAPISSVLAQEPEYISLPNLMVRDGIAAYGLQPPTAAYRLLMIALRDCPEISVDWLARLLSKHSAFGLRIIPLWGINAHRPTMLLKDVELVPFS